jgi:hypothetical protein
MVVDTYAESSTDRIPLDCLWTSVLFQKATEIRPVGDAERCRGVSFMGRDGGVDYLAPLVLPRLVVSARVSTTNWSSRKEELHLVMRAF